MEVNDAFRLALDLAFATGRRIGAILCLQWEDVRLGASEHAPYGTIRWRREHDEIGNEHVTPMNRLAHDALAAALRQRPGIGATWIFPAETDPSRVVERRLANRWFRKAERLAGLEHVKGRGWHAFRRGWATAVKGLPDVDVAAAGGWKELTSLKTCYQQADPETMYRVAARVSPQSGPPPGSGRRASRAMPFSASS